MLFFFGPFCLYSDSQCTEQQGILTLAKNDHQKSNKNKTKQSESPHNLNHIMALTGASADSCVLLKTSISEAVLQNSCWEAT